MLLYHSYQATFLPDEKSPYIFTASVELISIVIIGGLNVRFGVKLIVLKTFE